MSQEFFLDHRELNNPATMWFLNWCVIFHHMTWVIGYGVHLQTVLPSLSKNLLLGIWWCKFLGMAGTKWTPDNFPWPAYSAFWRQHCPCEVIKPQWWPTEPKQPLLQVLPPRTWCPSLGDANPSTTLTLKASGKCSFYLPTSKARKNIRNRLIWK